MLEQITGLEETVRRLVAERDEARADRTLAIGRAELAETYGVALNNAIKTLNTEIRDLRTRLAAAQRALDAATRPVQPPAEPEGAPQLRALSTPPGAPCAALPGAGHPAATDRYEPEGVT